MESHPWLVGELADRTVFFILVFLLIYHAHSSQIRLWRKNRSAMMCKKDQWFRERCCGGVDLNRNFDWFWGGMYVYMCVFHRQKKSKSEVLEIGSSSDRCSEIYQGKGPFSEAEARFVLKAVAALVL